MAAIAPRMPMITPPTMPKAFIGWFSQSCRNLNTNARNRGASRHSGPHPMGPMYSGCTVSSQCRAFHFFHHFIRKPVCCLVSPAILKRMARKVFP